MATEIINESQLRLRYNQGLDVDGKPIYKTKNYNYLKTTVTSDDMQVVALAIAGLQQHTLENVQRNSNYEIVAG